MAQLLPFTITIFGASGDLAKRKLFPAIFNLHHEKSLNVEFALVGFARSEMSNEQFIELVRDALEKFTPDFKSKQDSWASFSQRLAYVQGAYDAPEGFVKLAAVLKEYEDKYKCHGNRVFHISTPPSVFDQVSTQLADSGMAQCTPAGICSRIIIEKPFGHDYKSARELNAKLNQCFLEKQIYRIDHYLGKETVQNILVLRFSNLLMESIWNYRYIDHVQITVSEELPIGSRGNYYDKVGACRDMMQNHLMQLLCITAMEPPNNIDSNEVRDEKVKILKSLREFDLSHIDHCAIRGQYGPSADGKQIAYRQEQGVDKNSNTDTYVACKVNIDNWRWMGTPFYLRTGKCMKSRYSEIFLQFKNQPKKIFGSVDHLKPDGILVRIQPDEGVSLHMTSKVPGAEIKLQNVALNFDYATTFHKPSPDGYERLLYDAILDKPALFIRADETEASWKFYEALLEHWANKEEEDFPNYFAGTMGPKSADKLIENDGRKWNVPRH